MSRTCPTDCWSKRNEVSANSTTPAPHPERSACACNWTGTSTRHQEIRQWVAAGDWNAMVRVVDGTAVFFNKIVDSMELPLDLSKIAEGNDPAALLAQRLLRLQHDDDRSRDIARKSAIAVE